jgi:hypothetical protein
MQIASPLSSKAFERRGGKGRGGRMPLGEDVAGAGPSEIRAARSTQRRERGHKLQREAPGRVESGQRSGGAAG